MTDKEIEVLAQALKRRRNGSDKFVNWMLTVLTALVIGTGAQVYLNGTDLAVLRNMVETNSTRLEEISEAFERHLSNADIHYSLRERVNSIEKEVDKNHP